MILTVTQLLGAAVLAIMLVAFVWPIASLMMASFDEGGSLDAYAKMATSVIYQRAFANTFIIAGLVTAIALLAAYPLAYLMASVPPRTARILTFVVLLPFWTSALVRTAAWMVLLQRNGAVNTALTGLVSSMSRWHFFTIFPR